MILKIVIPVIVIICCYYTGLFIYYYRKTKSTKTALKNTVILLLPLLVLFFLVEFTFRILVSNELMHKDDRFFTRNFATAYYFIHKNKLPPDRHIRLRERRPNEVISIHPGKDNLENSESLKDTLYTEIADSDGFILPAITSHDRTIFFLGGSTTECLFNQESLRFPYLVGKKLNAIGLSYNVRNAGFQGNHTMQSVNNLVNKILKYRPSILVYMEAINDMSILLNEDSYYNTHPTRSLIVDERSNLRKKFVAGTMDEFFERRNNLKGVDTVSVYKEYKEALCLLIDICRSKHITPVLMTQFNRIDYAELNTCSQVKQLVTAYKNISPGFDAIAVYKRMNDIVRETAGQKQVFLIDLDRLVPKNPTYMYDAVHLNDSGSIYVADIISAQLTKYLATAQADNLQHL